MQKVVASGEAWSAARRRMDGVTQRNAGEEEEQSATRRELMAWVVRRLEKRAVVVARQPWHTRVSNKLWWLVASDRNTNWWLALISSAFSCSATIPDFGLMPRNAPCNMTFYSRLILNFLYS